MEDFEDDDYESLLSVRASEIATSEKLTLDEAAKTLVRDGVTCFEYKLKRFHLKKSGPSHNPGYQVETENLDGTGRFRNSWSALNGDQDWQIKCVSKHLARLMAYTESK